MQHQQMSGRGHVYRQGNPPRSPDPPDELDILTWNIDGMAPNADERLFALLSYIHERVFDFSIGSPEPACILLQEVPAQLFQMLRRHHWVRRSFVVYPQTIEAGWPRGAPFGNVTLVSVAVRVAAYGYYSFRSRQGRHVYFVDVDLFPYRNDQALLPVRDPFRLRIANVHLESSSDSAALRRAQLDYVAGQLGIPGLHGGIAGGSMGMVTLGDATVHREVGLRDAYRGREDEWRSFTWGYQPPTQYPPERLDRFYYRRGESLSQEYSMRVHGPRVVGAGVQTDGGIWLSDHHGLQVKVRFERR